MCEQPTLHGLGILVTRPAHQAAPLCRLIAEHGGNAILCPALEITAPPHWESAVGYLQQLSTYNLAIFSSVNAVQHAWPVIAQHPLPPHLEIAAIGAATATALTAHGIQNCLRPAYGFTSEALLALPRFQTLHGQRILLIRGTGGRSFLANTLNARGAAVDRAEVYARTQPVLNDAERTNLLTRWEQGEVGAVVITSSESLQNLFAMLGTDGQPYIRSTPLVVVSARIERDATRQGCRHIQRASEASDSALHAALLDLARTLPPKSAW